MKNKQKPSKKLRWTLLVAVVLILVGFGAYVLFRKISYDAMQASLPDISYFETHKSDRFPVDMDLVQGGNPYKGERSITPHTGAHIIFGDDYKSWPRGGNAPSNYPPIYAVANGVVKNVENSVSLEQNDKYEVDIAIAKGYTFEYSIEPFVKEPSPGFYKQFIQVRAGQRVHKGQVVAYMYLPKQSQSGTTHIHFDLDKTQTFLGLNGPRMAPAIFTTQIVSEFHDKWGNFGRDGSGPGSQGTQIPVCMGYRLAASENPFASVATDCLE